MEELIQTTGREVKTKSLEMLAAEIRTINMQMKQLLLSGLIEIGRRFEEAKAQVPYGEWGKWRETMTGYKQSMAENYIKVYREYGDSQLTLFGDLSESQLLGNLGITKLIELTVIEPERREEFVAENNVEDLSLKELKELLAKEKEKTKKLKADMKQAVEDAVNDAEIAAKEDAEKAVQDKIDKLNNEKTELSDRLSAMSKEVSDYKEKFNKADGERKAADIKAKASEEKRKEAERQKDELRAEVVKLKTAAEKQSDTDAVKLNYYFETVQNDISQLFDALDGLKDREDYGKLNNAIMGTLIKMLQERK